LTHRDPIETIRQGLVENMRSDHRDETDAGDVLQLLSEVGEAGAEPVVLLLDQFEQFFVHYKRRKERQAFIQLMANWYRGMPANPVKILVCLRGDFSDRLIELQKAMGYSLGPQESFRLEKFE